MFVLAPWRLLSCLFSSCFYKEESEHEIEKLLEEREEIYLTCNCFRYITKEDVAVASLDKVKKDGGHVRLITKESGPQEPSTQ